MSITSLLAGTYSKLFSTVPSHKKCTTPRYNSTSNTAVPSKMAHVPLHIMRSGTSPDACSTTPCTVFSAPPNLCNSDPAVWSTSMTFHITSIALELQSMCQIRQNTQVYTAWFFHLFTTVLRDEETLIACIVYARRLRQNGCTPTPMQFSDFCVGCAVIASKWHQDEFVPLLSASWVLGISEDRIVHAERIVFDQLLKHSDGVFITRRQYVQELDDRRSLHSLVTNADMSRFREPHGS